MSANAWSWLTKGCFWVAVVAVVAVDDFDELPQPVARTARETSSHVVCRDACSVGTRVRPLCSPRRRYASPYQSSPARRRVRIPSSRRMASRWLTTEYDASPRVDAHGTSTSKSRSRMSSRLAA